MPSVLRSVWLAAGVALLVACPSTARADSCEDECQSCSKEEECPDTGVVCDEQRDDYAACVEDAEGRGLVVACTDYVYVYAEDVDDERDYEQRLYCDPEEGGCGVRAGGRTRTLPLAAAVFAVAAAATVVRHRRRHRR